MFEFLPGADSGPHVQAQQKPIDQFLQEQKQQEADAEKLKDDTTVSEGIGAAAMKGTIGLVDRFVQNLGYDPTPGFTIQDSDRKRWEKNGIRPEQWPLFGKAVSADHLSYLEGLAFENQESDKTLAQFGMLGNIGLSLVSDPGMVALDALAAPLAYSAQVGRVGNAIRAGAVAATEAAALEAGHAQFNPEIGWKDGAEAAAMSFAFAGALGARRGAALGGGRVSMEQIHKANAGADAPEPNINDTLSSAKVGGGVPDPTPGAAPLRSPSEKEQGWLDRARSEAYIVPAFAGIRRDLAARMGSSESPMMRLAGRTLFRDGVGNVKNDWQFKNVVERDAQGNITKQKKVRLVPGSEEWRAARDANMDIAVGESTTEFSKRHMGVVETQWRSGINAAWAEHRKAANIPSWNLGAKHEFYEEVGRAVRGATDVSDAAKKAAGPAAQAHSYLLDLAKKSGLDGFDNVTNNPNYLARYWSNKGYQRLFGEGGITHEQFVEHVLKPSMRKRWEETLPPRSESKFAQVEESYRGASDQVREAKAKYDEHHTQLVESQKALNDAEAYLKDNPGLTGRQLRAAQKKIRDANAKVDKARVRRDGSGQKHVEALKREDESKFAFNEAKKVADLDVVDEDLLDAVARAYLKRAQQDFEGDQLALGVRPLDTGSVEEIAGLLKDAGVDPAKSEGILGRLQRSADENGKIGRARQRIDLDENFETTITNDAGKDITVRMSDLFDNNIESVLTRYSREVIGWSAMASKADVKNAAELARWRNAAISEAKAAKEDLRDYNRMLDIGINATFGRSTEVNPGSKAAGYARVVRNWNFARVMNKVGFSLFAELGPTIAHGGLKNFVESTMHIRDFLQRGADGRLRSQEARVVEELFAPGTEWMRNPPLMRLDDDGLVPPAFGDSKFGRAVDNVTMGAAHVTSVMSGMSPVNTMLQRIAGRGTLQKLIKQANAKKALSKAEVQRLRTWGLSEKDQAAVFGALKGVKKIDEIDPSKLDFDTRERMSAFLFRVTRHQVLEGDVSDSLQMMHSVTGKLIMQFRTFMVNSYTRHFLNSVHHYNDWRTYMMAALSTSAAGMGWAARAYLSTIGNPEMREKMLTEENFYKNAVAQSSWSHFIPAVTDMVWADVLHNDPIFANNRSTGLSNGIMGIPTLDLASKLYSSTGMIGSALKDDEHVTNKQVHDFWKTTFWNNMLGWQNITDAAIDEHFPRDN